MRDATMAERADEDIHWLDPIEQAAWRAFLDATRDLFQRLTAQLQDDSGMSLADYEILVTLSEAPDQTLRMGALARAVRASSSRLSHTVTRMEQNGWVRRESHPADRRGQVAVLTEKGRSVLAAAAPGHVAAVRRHLLDALTADQVAQLAEISGAVRVGAGSPAGIPGQHRT